MLFMEKLPYLAVSELFYMAYFSYYVMISGLGVIFYIRDKELFWRYVSLVSFVFYVCFLIFIALPVVGPYERVEALGGGQYRFAPVPYPAAVQAGPFFQLMKLIYAYAEAPSAAFPSSHVAVALCTLYFSCRFLPRLRWPHAPVVVLLCAATVYCRYHYVVDVLAGALTAALLLPVGEWLYRKAGGAARAKPGAGS
jgi:membrane-associated phospholipid phosphatase